MISDPRGVYAEAADWFAGLVARVDNDWGAPALGSWNRRDLVGHMSRSLLTVESYLQDGPAPVEAASAVDYFVRIRPALAETDDVTERGRAAGRALGDDPAAAVETIAERVLALVAAAGIDAYVGTPWGDLLLAEYLRTRIVELVVHGCDLAVACALDADVPMRAAAETGAVLVALAAHDGRAADLLLAVTGRRSLPAGFTVL